MTEKMELMNTISQGVYVIGTKTNDTYNLMTAAWLTQVSFVPCRIALSVGRTHYTAELIKNQGSFTISVLAKGQENIAKACGYDSGLKVDKTKRVDFKLTEEGLPVISNAVAHMTCSVTETYDIGDHFLFIAEIQGGELTKEETLLYVSETYF